MCRAIILRARSTRELLFERFHVTSIMDVFHTGNRSKHRRCFLDSISSMVEERYDVLLYLPRLLNPLGTASILVEESGTDIL